MIGWDVSVGYRRGQYTQYIEVWEQPRLRWLVAKAYHFWDMKFAFLMRPTSRLHRKFNENTEDYIPLVNRQDIRCDHLHRKQRKILTRVEITREQYTAITGKHIFEG